MNPKQPTQRSTVLALVLSAVLPGAGQAFLGQWRRGLAIFFAFASALATVVWYAQLGWIAPVVVLWAWNLWDVSRQPKGAPVLLAAVAWLAMAYGIGWQVTEIRPAALFENTNRARMILEPMLRPDFITENKEVRTGYAEIEVPCSTTPRTAEHTEDGITVKVTPACAAVNEIIIVQVEGLLPNQDIQFAWRDPIGAFPIQKNLKADADGKLTLLQVVEPIVQNTIPDPTKPAIHKVTFTQERLTGGVTISEVGRYILQGVYETLALALLSTFIGALLAIPMGFLAARNLMSGNPLTMAVYVVVRTVLNIIRSIESLILAIIFVVIVGLGPFPGMLAITLHTVAALGKLYSEVIEGIDTGPIEAIRATGASWLQVVRYAVIPQIVPSFTALTIYRWDINIRSSTIIGFVGGGGIGFFLYQWILLQDFRAVSACFITIAVVVIVLDFFSARLRERLV